MFKLAIDYLIVIFCRRELIRSTITILLTSTSITPYHYSSILNFMIDNRLKNTLLSEDIYY